jgi:shikimate kinase
VLNPQNRERLKARGVVIYLRCHPHELYQRTRHDRNRPLLQTGDPLARLQALYAQRHPLYMQTADIVLETGRQSVHCLVRKLEGVLSLSGTPEPGTVIDRDEGELDASCADFPKHQPGERQPGP